MSTCPNGFEVYKIYLALKNHFTKNDYDYVKYNGKVSVAKLTFERRKDRWHFEKIAKKYKHNSFEFLLSNLVDNPKFWAGRAMDKRYDEIYNKWIGYVEGDIHHFRKDILTLKEYCDEYEVGFNDLFEFEAGKYPVIFKMYKKGHIHFYTLCILAQVTQFHRRLDEKNSFDPVWKEESNKIHKTISFCKLKSEYGKIVTEIFDG